MIIPEYPFLLLHYDEQWSTPENCPEIENFYYCKQELLQKSQTCIADIIKQGKNHCHDIHVQLTETTIEQINSDQLLVIPVEPIDVQAKCETNGIFRISNPSLISLKNCVIEVNNKIFQSEETLHDELVFELPQLNFSSSTSRLPAIRIKSIKKKLVI